MCWIYIEDIMHVMLLHYSIRRHLLRVYIFFRFFSSCVHLTQQYKRSTYTHTHICNARRRSQHDHPYIYAVVVCIISRSAECIRQKRRVREYHSEKKECCMPLCAQCKFQTADTRSLSMCRYFILYTRTTGPVFPDASAFQILLLLVSCCAKCACKYK